MYTYISLWEPTGVRTWQGSTATWPMPRWEKNESAITEASTFRHNGDLIKSPPWTLRYYSAMVSNEFQGLKNSAPMMPGDAVLSDGCMFIWDSAYPIPDYVDENILWPDIKLFVTKMLLQKLTSSFNFSAQICTSGNDRRQLGWC